jgi:hypothetical protein
MSLELGRPALCALERICGASPRNRVSLPFHLTNGKTAIAAKLGRNKPPDEIKNIAICLTDEIGKRCAEGG